MSRLFSIILVLLLFASSANTLLAQEQRGELVSGGVKQVAVDSTAKDTVKKIQLQSPIFKDTISISKVTAISLIAPGFAQLYNKQYWKIPVLYASVGTLAYLTAGANKNYKTYKTEYNRLLYDEKASRDVIDPVQTKMIKYNTQRQLLFLGAAFAYIYFIGDGAINYPNYSHPVKKATTLAMIFPGAGQIYNKSYWKVPIVMGAFATMGYIIDFNARGYTRFKEAYNRFPNDEFSGRITQTQLQNLRDQYRRNRDLSILITCGLYVLSVVEAHVDAYMKDYDISDDLSMRIEPTLINMGGINSTNYAQQGFGMSLKLNF